MAGTSPSASAALLYSYATVRRQARPLSSVAHQQRTAQAEAARDERKNSKEKPGSIAERWATVTQNNAHKARQLNTPSHLTAKLRGGQSRRERMGSQQREKSELNTTPEKYSRAHSRAHRLYTRHRGIHVVQKQLCTINGKPQSVAKYSRKTSSCTSLHTRLVLTQRQLERLDSVSVSRGISIFPFSRHQYFPLLSSSVRRGSTKHRTKKGDHKEKAIEMPKVRP
mmetsp:Transcript_51717/g.129888  ORF Transcript_51717/g.129888 Transcript_51717/m.129888 type:complete len:225 (+) Transcript_51717:900-1574(+)